MKKLLLIILLLGMGSNSFGFDVGPDIHQYFEHPVTQSQIRNVCYEYESLTKSFEILQEDMKARIQFIQKLISVNYKAILIDPSIYISMGLSQRDWEVEIAKNSTLIAEEQQRVALLHNDAEEIQRKLNIAWTACELIKEQAREQYRLAESLENLPEDPNDLEDLGDLTQDL